LLNDCAPLAASKLRVVVALVTGATSDSTAVIALLKQLGIGRAVVIAIGKGNHTLIDLLERHPERIAAASFVADKALAKALRSCTENPRIHGLLRNGRQRNIARAVAKTRRPVSAYGAVQAWAGRIVDGCRTGIRNCSALLAGLELTGLIQFDDGGDDEETVSEAS
jgi:NAD(P)-dependent dehydrogenase (short-subunit alcohol dehydrogenase family)